MAERRLVSVNGEVIRDDVRIDGDALVVRSPEGEKVVFVAVSTITGVWNRPTSAWLFTTFDTCPIELAGWSADEIHDLLKPTGVRWNARLVGASLPVDLVRWIDGADDRTITIGVDLAEGVDGVERGFFARAADGITGLEEVNTGDTLGEALAGLPAEIERAEKQSR